MTTLPPQSHILPKICSSKQVFVSHHLRERHPAVFENLKLWLEPENLVVFPGARDLWCRDYLPIPVAPGELVQFAYYPSYLKHADALRTRPEEVPFVHSFGKIEHSSIILDGGNCVLGPNRAILTERIYRDNPSWSRSALRQELQKLLRVEHLTIIPPEPGDLFGHVDGVVRFLNADTVLINNYRLVDPEYETRLRKVLHREKLEVQMLGYAPTNQVSADGIPSAMGLYLNFIQTSRHILFPLFGLIFDQMIWKSLAKLFPQHSVCPVECRELAKEGGLLNCISWQPTPASLHLNPTKGIE